MKMVRLQHIIYVILIVLLRTSLCFPQTPPEMVYDVEHSDISILEVSKDIAIMYGGIGKPERKLIEKLGKDYNLKLVFIALPRKKYLSNVEVNIINEKGQKIVKVISKGPLFYAKIPSGIVTIKTIYKGKVKTNTHVEITKGGQRSMYFSWNIEKTID